MKNMMMDRREFLKNLGMLSTGAVLLSSPWLSVFADVKETAKENVDWLLSVRDRVVVS